MSELTQWQPAAAPALPTTSTFYADPTGGRLIAWADGLAAAHRIGTALCGTAFAPANFKGKPDEAAAAILYGDEIGLTPTQALQSVHVISGKPGLYARAMVALVMAKGHDVWTVEETPSKVTVAGRRRGSSHTEQVTWTMERARKAGYTKNQKYDQNPEEMLYARAAATVCRRIAPDALAGLAYSVEELEVEEAPATATITRVQQVPAKVQRKAAPEPAEPEFDQPAPESTPEPTYRTEAQSKKMFALAREVWPSDDDFRAYLNEELGREVETTKTLTKAEAMRIIDGMELLAAIRDARAAASEPETDADA